MGILNVVSLSPKKLFPFVYVCMCVNVVFFFIIFKLKYLTYTTEVYPRLSKEQVYFSSVML